MAGSLTDGPDRRPTSQMSLGPDSSEHVRRSAELRTATSRRINFLFAVLACVAAAAAGAWYAGSRIESPAEVAARTKAPPPSPILVPIERRVLSTDVVTRGTVRFGLPQQVSLAPSTLKTGPGLITSLSAKNAQINEGDVLVTASGRPVLVLMGQIPAYRDLVPRLNGQDVRQLEEALKRLGFDPGPVDGVYDQQTSAAVAKLYKARGWDAFGPTVDQLTLVRNLEREWADAMKAKAAANAAVTNAALAVDAARAASAHATRAAALENATRTPDRRGGTGGAPGVPLAVANERAKAAHANTAADADVAAQIADRALIVLDPRQPETARSSADAKLEVARAARERILLEGEVAVRTAERDAGLTSDRVELGRAAQRSVAAEGERSVRAAIDAQKLAQLDLRIASDRADQVAADLDPARRRLGFQIPLDEIVFIRSLPVRVEEVTAVIGGSAAGPVLTVTDNQLAIDSALPLDAAALIKPGQKVAIDESALGIKATGIVETVASTPGTRNVDRFHVYMGIKVETASVPLEGASVRLTIPIESTKGEVLAVPVSALSLSTDGTSRVQVQTEAGLDYITVQPGLSAGGYVEVTPVTGTISAGQMVVVGYSNPSSRESR
jgi:peptidoglycan hydrolase-like protein with peptidoglycan-binding domain